MKVLVDTSFLLPALGVSVEDEIIEAIKYFHQVEVCYAEASLLEAMWKVLRVVPPEELKTVEDGINAIRNTYTQIAPTGSSFTQAYMLYQKGHKDFIDDLLYAISAQHRIFFLTIDRKFISFLRSIKEDLSLVITPNEFINML